MIRERDVGGGEGRGRRLGVGVENRPKGGERFEVLYMEAVTVNVQLG